MRKDRQRFAQVVEYTSVTQRIRRVARFDAEVVKKAIQHNRPTCIVLNHLDYVDARCSANAMLTDEARRFVETVEDLIGARISLLGFGPASLSWRASAERAVA